jgi:hypothetical protein
MQARVEPGITRIPHLSVTIKGLVEFISGRFSDRGRTGLKPFSFTDDEGENAHGS